MHGEHFFAGVKGELQRIFFKFQFVKYFLLTTNSTTED